MQLAESDIRVLIDQIWLTTLGLATHPLGDQPPVVGRVPTLDGLVMISGGWSGTVTLTVPRALAERIASNMCQMGEGAKPTLADMQDSLGEITNMTGGNLKALLPGECQLSLPVVIEGGDSLCVLDSRLVAQVGFECEGHTAVVSVMAAGTED